MHMAPAHGYDDYIALGATVQRDSAHALDLGLFQCVDDAGCFENVKAVTGCAEKLVGIYDLFRIDAVVLIEILCVCV